MPAALITTTAFRGLAESERATKGVPELPLIVIDHPLGGVALDTVARRALQTLEALEVAARTRPLRPVQPA
ncbi:MAG: hypothetical protein A2X52_06670 [Candidatus Rokubacteria bacterium GWC2_70_16]|nr:MAG: hypothetical protein A2X52_06670 [Candidatus Rokubacteria bacterium GWC2_70_16]OGL14763.1 MAG: hypothetical protein A3K12_10270 [Candidatus Rokubacteria bacterium RIFCSPLOWO2_12_FULL_71_19]